MGAGVIGYIFYNEIWAGLLFLWAVPVYALFRGRNFTERRKQKTAVQFKDGMNGVAVALSAGYSVENAFIEAKKEAGILYGSTSEITRFFMRVEKQLAVNRNIEEVLTEFALWSGVEDIIAFAEVFSYAKRSGGDMVEIIKDTIMTIGQKMDTAREISVLISAKQTEQLIMDIVPAAIILYLRVTSPELIGRLYGNMTGVFVMTACLAVYAAAVILSIRIADIRV